MTLQKLVEKLPLALSLVVVVGSITLSGIAWQRTGTAMVAVNNMATALSQYITDNKGIIKVGAKKIIVTDAQGKEHEFDINKLIDGMQKVAK